MRLRAVLAIAAGLALGACAGPPEREQSRSMPLASFGQLEELASRLPGRYGAARRLDQEQPGTQMQLSTVMRGDGTLVLEFRELLEKRQRGFILTLSSMAATTFIPGRFHPLQTDGTPSAQSCAMRFVVRDGLLSGETDPDQCRFGASEDAVGLLKEVALDADQVIIADQLIAAGTGEDNPPDILRLYRLDSFLGQVRVREQAGSGWRTAEEFLIAVGSRPIEPLDAADMPLDVVIRLELIQGQQPGSPLLSLQALQSDTDNMLGHVWADRQARRLGLALDHIQVDLEKPPPRP
ncbi:MAG: hypothetical protein V2J42_03410 [Wenzhouxiangella sp.]|jgi:hypothetical protein|nr:hypothetical protein [Wenzhouxiangella sp.]